MNATPGDKIKLDAAGTFDPDGNQLSYKWWQYREAGSYPGSIGINNSNKQQALITVPKNTKMGDTIHVICEVTDNVSPKLTRYQRVIIAVQ